MTLSTNDTFFLLPVVEEEQDEVMEHISCSSELAELVSEDESSDRVINPGRDDSLSTHSSSDFRKSHGRSLCDLGNAKLRSQL